MPTNDTCQISAEIRDLGYAPDDGAIIELVWSGDNFIRQNNALIPSSRVEYRVPETGLIDFSLVPGNYKLRIYSKPVGWSSAIDVTVPDATVAHLAQLPALPAPATLDAAQQAVLDAQIARDEANASVSTVTTSLATVLASEANVVALEAATQVAKTGAELSETNAGASETAAAGHAQTSSDASAISVTAKDEAVLAQTGSEEARDESESARDSASGHRLNAYNSEVAAETAQALTEAARDVTLLSEGRIATHAATAEISATNSLNSATQSSDILLVIQGIQTAVEADASATQVAKLAVDLAIAAASGAITDGDFVANGLMKRTAAGTYTSVTDNSANWNTAFGWGDHAAEGYITGEVDTLATVTARGATTTAAVSITNATESTSVGTGALTVGGGVGIDGNINVSGDAVFTGNLTVNGTTTSVNSNTVNIGDNIILLNADETGVPSQDGGIEIERGTSANVSFKWVEASDSWSLGNENLIDVIIDGGSY